MKKLKKTISFITLLFLIAAVFVTVKLVQTAQKFFLEAEGIKANIIVDTSRVLGQFSQPWRAFSQGGEEPGKEMIAGVVEEVRALKPDYIRLDHIFDDDYYSVVSGSPANLEFDWTKLDKTVEDIMRAGAKPFFSLSYMPLVLAGNKIDKPYNWQDWQFLVQKTIEHYSGKDNKGIYDVYYEVWNEPDHEQFGGWKIRGGKNYEDLYLYAARGALAAKNTRPFKIGGPATTGFYKNWVKRLFELADQQNLPLDFISWHRYSVNPQDYSEDVEALSSLIAEDYPELASREKIISEWGHNSDKDSKYSQGFSAAHALATIRILMSYPVKWAFAFEVKDGPESDIEKSWGLISHENKGKVKKPRYQLFRLINSIGSNLLSLSGEGSWVTAWATKKEGTVNVVLVNYDRYSFHSEAVPVNFINLEPGSYQYRQEFLLQIQETVELKEVLNSTSLTKKIYMPANSVVFLQLTKLKK